MKNRVLVIFIIIILGTVHRFEDQIRKERKPYLCSALKCTPGMICRIQRGQVIFVDQWDVFKVGIIWICVKINPFAEPVENIF